MYTRKVRIPFENKISKHFSIKSCEVDETCGSGIHSYQVEAVNDAGDVVFSKEINFQHGALAEPFAEFNGLLSNVYLTILIDHLSSFMAGPYANSETEHCLFNLKQALHWMAARSDERDSRDVLGKHAS